MASTIRVPADARGALHPGGGWVPVGAGQRGDTIATRFEAVVGRHGDRVAVDDGSTVLSYSDLERRTAAIAAELTARRPTDRARGVRVAPPGNVAVLLDQGLDFVVALLAVLRSGAMAVPLDPAYSDPILRSLVGHAETTAIVAGAGTVDAGVRLVGEQNVVDVRTANDQAASGARPWTPPAIRVDDPATLFYTSGSTGRPKGVVDSHANILDNVRRYVDSLAIGPDDRLSLIHGPMFSGLISSCFSALLTGATVLPFDVRRHGVDRLAAWMTTSGMTMLHVVPAVFRAVVQAPEVYPAMRVVRLEGDLATWSDVQAFRERFGPTAMLVNGLGATETGLTRQFFVSATAPSPGLGGLPIGYPVDGIDVAIVDASGQTITDGGVGEIVVSGRHLSVGYWRDRARTDEAFRPDPSSSGEPAVRTYRTGDLGRMDPDGCLHHLGRVDAVRKVRGQTVDPTMTERALLARPDVRAAVAVTRADEDDDVRLIAYVTPAASERLDPVEIRRGLAAGLPPILIPTSIVVVDAIPLTAAGKVDREALPAPGSARPELSHVYVGPRDPLEERILEAWKTVIDVRPIGVNDEFFDLGGDSLGATTMLLELGRRLDQEIPVGILGRAATIAGLASELRALDTRPTALDPPAEDDGELVTLARGDGPTIVAIHSDAGNPLFYRAVARSLGSTPTVHSLQPATPTAGRRFEPIDATARRYVRSIRAVQPTGPYIIVGYCFAGVVASEVARQIALDGDEDVTLMLLSVGPLEFPTLVGTAARRRYARGRLRLRFELVEDAVRRMGLRHGMEVAVRGMGRLVRRHLYLWTSSADAGPRVGSPDVAAVSAKAIADHRAVPYPGRLTVVVGRQARPRYLRDPVEDLGGLATDGVDLVVLPGDDHAMLIPPVSDLLADLILERATAGGERQGSRYPVP